MIYITIKYYKMDFKRKREKYYSLKFNKINLLLKNKFEIFWRKKKE